MHEPVQNLTLWWFDIAVGVWLLIGLFRGRKNGMSGELLLLIKWVLIIVGAAYTYATVGAVIREYSSISPEWCYRIAYLGIAFVIAVALGKLQSLLGDKLLGNDFFGGAEYYLGMVSGMVRFACMVVLLLAFLNARIPSPDEIKHFNSKTEELGPAQFNPLKVERQILLDSVTGRFVRENLSALLIQTPATAPVASKPAETIAVKKQRMVDELIDPQNKP